VATLTTTPRHPRLAPLGEAPKTKFAFSFFKKIGVAKKGKNAKAKFWFLCVRYRNSKTTF